MMDSKHNTVEMDNIRIKNHRLHNYLYLIVFLLCSTSLSAEESPNFDLFELQVDGNTVLDSALIEKTLYPFLGTKKSVDDV